MYILFFFLEELVVKHLPAHHWAGGNRENLERADRLGEGEMQRRLQENRS